MKNMVVVTSIEVPEESDSDVAKFYAAISAHIVLKKLCLACDFTQEERDFFN